MSEYDDEKLDATQALAAKLARAMTARKKMSRDEIECALLDLVKGFEAEAYQRGRDHERERGVSKVAEFHRNQIALAFGGWKQGEMIPTLGPAATDGRIIEALIEEVKAWRKFDQDERSRCLRLGRESEKLIDNLMWMASLLRRESDSFTIGAKGPALQIHGIFSRVAERLRDMLYYEIQFPRWRSEGGHKPPEDKIGAWITIPSDEPAPTPEPGR